MKITSHSNSDLISQKTTNFAEESENTRDVTEDTSAPQSRAKSKIFRRKGKDIRLLSRKPIPSQQSIKRTNKLEKKTRSYSTKTSMIDRSTTTIMKRRVLNSLRPSNMQS